MPLACAPDATNCARSPLNPRGFALELGEARQLHQIARIKIAHAGKLAVDQFDFLGLGGLLALDAGDLFFQLLHALLQLRLLAKPFGAAQREQFVFTVDGVFDVRVVWCAPARRPET